MLFTSDEFLVFLGVVVVTLQVLRGGAARRWAMLAFCVWFYASWSLQFLGLLVGSVALDWAIALRLGKDTQPSVRRALVIASIAMNLGMLGVFKYAGFAAVTLNDGLRLLGTGLRVPVPHLILPLGISFYIFQSISYTVDVYRGLLPPTRSLRDLATFVMFFPHLVSGPIVRAAELLPQLARLDTPAPAEDLAVGARHFVLGFARKVLVADTLAPLADATFADPGRYGASSLSVGLLAYAMQIYFDFSGYSQMAVGLARMFGIHFPDNFDTPYLSRSLQEFWRRWHISLSRFLRDYLYIPLGGSRHGAARTVTALSLTMLIGGFWHGASWTFVVWGAIHGAGQAVAWLYRERLRGPAAARFWDSRAGDAVGWTLTMAVAWGAWVYFRAPDLARGNLYLTRMVFGAAGDASLAPSLAQLGAFGLAAAVHVGAVLRPVWAEAPPWPSGRVAQGALLGAVYAVLVALQQADSPFIYFNF